jgi:hypothetical protein
MSNFSMTLPKENPISTLQILYACYKFPTTHATQDNPMTIDSDGLNVCSPVILSDKVNQDIDTLIFSFLQDLLYD